VLEGFRAREHWRRGGDLQSTQKHNKQVCFSPDLFSDFSLFRSVNLCLLLGLLFFLPAGDSSGGGRGSGRICQCLKVSAGRRRKCFLGAGNSCGSVGAAVCWLLLEANSRTSLSDKKNITSNFVFFLCYIFILKLIEEIFIKM
jgi:hypothetical protein